MNEKINNIYFFCPMLYGIMITETQPIERSQYDSEKTQALICAGYIKTNR